MKKHNSLKLALGLLATTTSLSAALLIDTDFSGVTGSSLPTPAADAFRLDLSDEGDQGWFGEGGSGFQDSVSAGELTLENGSTFNPSTTIASGDQQFGQWNNDNSASTGEWFFEFEVTGFNLGGGESLQFAVEIFENTNPTAPFNDFFGLSGQGAIGSNVNKLGQVNTGSITGTGTFATSAFDFGTGVDAVGIAISAVNPDGSFGDSVTITSVNPVAVPEPSTLALFLGFASLAVILWRRSH